MPVTEEAVTVQEAVPPRAINFYKDSTEIDLTRSNVLNYEPLTENGKEAKRGFRAEIRTREGGILSLNMFSFANFTKAFGIQGSQAIHATPDYLNHTIMSMAHNRNIETCYAVGDRNRVFTRDLQGVQVLAGLMDNYAPRRFSEVKSTSLTLNRVGFTPRTGDQHFIDAIVTASVTFGLVNFNTYTEILRQVCTNGMTRTISSSNRKNLYSADWIPTAIEQTNRQMNEMTGAVDAMCNARVVDPMKTMENINVSGIPEWVGISAQTLFENANKNTLELKEKDKLCPFGLKTLWDFLNLYTYAMHQVTDIANKQKLQERLYKYTFRNEFVSSLQESGAVA